MLTSGDLNHGVIALLWLAVILASIFAASRVARLLPALRRGLPAQGAVTIRGSIALDGRRRLHLVEVGGRDALVLTGGQTDVVLSLPAASS